MLVSLRWLVLPAVMAGCLGLIVPAPVGAQGSLNAFRVEDRGKFFSQEARDRADARIATIKRTFNKDLRVETYSSIPSDLKAKYDENSKSQFFANWSRSRYERQDVHGVLILICREPRFLYVEMGKREAARAFTPANQKELRTLLLKHFGKEEYDKGLLAAVEYVGDTFQKTVGKTTAGATPAERPGRAAQEGEKAERGLGNGGSSMLGWVCIGVGVLLAVWVVIGLFRAMSGAGRPIDRPPGNYAPGGGGPGYGPGYGPGAPAAGGGGFMSGLLGGMLGGAAGAWAYDRFFRGDSPGGGMTPSAYGGTPTTPTGPDQGYGGDAGGGTWGDAGSGAADTGGGGDWGGGGDSGGGDWGGGGDSGGGDWGGGDDGGGGDW